VVLGEAVFCWYHGGKGNSGDKVFGSVKGGNEEEGSVPAPSKKEKEGLIVRCGEGH